MMSSIFSWHYKFSNSFLCKISAAKLQRIFADCQRSRFRGSVSIKECRGDQWSPAGITLKYSSIPINTENSVTLSTHKSDTFRAINDRPYKSTAQFTVFWHAESPASGRTFLLQPLDISDRMWDNISYPAEKEERTVNRLKQLSERSFLTIFFYFFIYIF
jgi:hypothetical protein